MSSPPNYYVEILPQNKEAGIGKWRWVLYRKSDPGYLVPDEIARGEANSQDEAERLARKEYERFDYINNPEHRIRIDL